VVKHAVILAGGAGTRLWPASTKKNPKQFLRLGGKQSLFAMTLQRAIGLGIEGMICIVTHKDHAQGIVDECGEVMREANFPAERIWVLAEPEGRNTAPAITYAAILLQQSASVGDTMIVLPADHLIEPLSVFIADVGKAARLAEQGWLVTFGIPPKGPETGYGYIETAEELDPGFRVRKFKEKPDEATAKAFLAQGNHYWNSGMFAFRVDRYLEELQSHALDVAAAFQQAVLPQDFPATAKQPVSTSSVPVLIPADQALEAVYQRSPAISIDYAVMEHSERSAVVPAEFSWSDIGSWDVVAELVASASESEEGANIITVESGDNFVLSDLPVALAGVQDLIVVVKNGTVLVCRKGKSQLVKDIVQILKEEDSSDLL
jgi:mannose-1-phosphate guanylyltransferase/mannose-6-phosphate isomerase